MTSASPSPTASSTLRLTVTGESPASDLAGLLDAITESDATVVDVQQLEVGGQPTLIAVLATDTPGELSAALSAAAQARRLTATITSASAAETASRAEAAPLPAAIVLVGTRIEAGDLGRVATVVSGLGATITRIRHLSRTPVVSVELQCVGAEVNVLRPALAEVAVDQAFDVAVMPGGLARHGRRLLIMDVDSTLIQDEVIELLAEHAGKREEVAAVTERAMRGELDFAQSLHARVATLAGLPESVLAETRARVRLTPGARTLVSTLKRLGDTVAVVSGGFIEVVQPLADELGIDHARANRLEVVDGHLTGKVLGEVVDRTVKARTLRALAEAENLPLERTVAVGDGANDLDMLALAGLGIAFNAKPIVQAQADAAINVPYLDTVLHLLGLTREEVAEIEQAQHEEA